MIMESRKKSSFWKAYWIVLGAALALVAVFFFVFFDIMDNYEKSQPHYGATVYTASLTGEKLEKILTDAAENCDTPYENADTVLRTVRESIGTSPLSFTKDYTAYSSANPVFTVSCGEIPLCSVTLGKGEELRYGFTSWKVVKEEPILSVHDLEHSTSLVYVPKDAVLYVNGIKAEEAPTGVFPSNETLKWEKNAPLKNELYEIDLIGEAEFSCILNGVECESRAEENGVYFLYPRKFLRSYTVEVPEAAEVTVNGILLGEADIKESSIPYPYSPMESSLADTPKAVLYHIDGLFSEPEISAVLGENKLPLTGEDNAFRAEYPEALLYSCTIRVPHGSTVSVRGVPCTAENITAAESEPKELFAYSGNPPTYDIYTLDRLFLAPADVEILYNGIALPAEKSEDGRTYTFRTSYPRVNSPEHEALALDFVKTYFTYTSNGYKDTHRNLLNVLTYIPYGCDLYWKMVQSENGFTWTTPVSFMSYNTLEVTELFSCPGDLRLCKIAFDVSQSFSDKVYREYSGIMSVLLTADGKVVGMEIAANS